MQHVMKDANTAAPPCAYAYERAPRQVDLWLRDYYLEHGKSKVQKVPWEESAFLTKKKTLAKAYLPADQARADA